MKTKYEVCPDCNGKGINGATNCSDNCEKCEGTGYIKIKK